MSNQPINNLNLNAPQWNYSATGAQDQVPGLTNPMLITPSYDATNITGGLPNTGAAQAMNANSASPTGNWYADWFSQWSNTMQGLNATIQGGAMPMDATTATSYNYAPVPNYYNNPNYINTYQGATPMQNQDPNQVNQNGDIVIPEASTDEDGNLNVTVGSKMDASGQLTGQNATIDSTAKDQTGSISSNDGTLANTITLKASDKDAGGNKVDIAADAKDTITTQGEGWTAKKNDDGTITLTQKTDGGKENTYTITPQKGTKVMVNGKDVNSTSIFQGEDVAANGIATGKPGDTDTSTLYGQLGGKGSNDIAKVDMSDTATVKLTDEQKKVVAQQYALAYTKEKLGDDGKNLTFDSLTQQQITDAKTAADKLDPPNTALSTALGNLKATNKASTNSDDLINKLKAGNYTLQPEDVDHVDFAAILNLPDKNQAQDIIRHMDVSKLPQNLQDLLAIKFFSSVDNKNADSFGVNRKGNDLSDNKVSDDDINVVKDMLAKGFGQKGLADRLGLITKDGSDSFFGFQKGANAKTTDQGFILVYTYINKSSFNSAEMLGQFKSGKTIDQIIKDGE